MPARSTGEFSLYSHGCAQEENPLLQEYVSSSSSSFSLSVLQQYLFACLCCCAHHMSYIVRPIQYTVDQHVMTIVLSCISFGSTIVLLHSLR
jgi:hypothetical protein